MPGVKTDDPRRDEERRKVVCQRQKNDGQKRQDHGEVDVDKAHLPVLAESRIDGAEGEQRHHDEKDIAVDQLEQKVLADRFDKGLLITEKRLCKVRRCQADVVILEENICCQKEENKKQQPAQKGAHQAVVFNVFDDGELHLLLFEKQLEDGEGQTGAVGDVARAHGGAGHGRDVFADAEGVFTRLAFELFDILF